MTIAFGAIGAKSAGSTTTITVAYPSSVGAGDALVIAGCGWPSTAGVNAISGWTVDQQGGGTGTSIDAHTTTIAAFHQVAAGGETGTVSVSRGGSPNGQLGIMARYTKTAANWVAPATAKGDDSSHGANRSVTTGTIDLATGDMVVVAVAVDTDTALTITSPTLTATGITFGTVTRRTTGAGVTTGQDGNVELFDAEVTAGSGTVAVTVAFTTATSQCGPIVITRLRETDAASYDRAPADPVGVTDALALERSTTLNDAVGVTDGGSSTPVGPAFTQADNWITSSGTATGTNYTRYKDVTVSVGSGDLIVAFGASANNSASAAGSIATQSGSTSAWTIGLENNADSSPGYVIGHAESTADGSVTVRVTIANENGALIEGAGVWVIPAGEWSGTPAYTTFGPNTTDPSPNVTLSATSTVLYAGSDWSGNAAMGTAYTPAGATVDVNAFSAGNYAVGAARWTGQTAGTRAYGPSSGAQSYVGAVVVITEATPSGSAVTLEVGKGLNDDVGITDSMSAVLDVGGASYTADPADPVGVTDATEVVQDVARTQSDTAAVTDAVQVVQDAARTQADAVGLIDAVALEQGRTIADPVGAGDALTLEVGRPLADPVGVTDALAIVREHTVSDAVGATDTAAAVQSTTRAIDDVVGVTDALTALLSTEVSQADPIGVTDAADATQDMQRGPADAVGVTDAATPVVDAQRNANDPVGVLDAVALARGLVDDDPVGITDAVAVTVDYVVTISDAVGATDALALERAKTVDDPVGVTDAVAQSRALSIEDTATASDAIALVRAQFLTIDDPVGGTDALSVSGGGQASLDDNVAITDAITVTQDAARTVADPVGATDALALERTRPLADAAGVTDAVTAVTAAARVIADAVEVTDAVQVEVSTGAQVDHDDAVGITDALDVTVAAQAQLNDVVTLTDGITVVLTRGVEIDELVTVSDTVQTAMLYEVILGDTMGVSDAVSTAGRAPVPEVFFLDFVEEPVRHLLWVGDPVRHLDWVPDEATYLEWVNGSTTFLDWSEG